MPGNFLALEQYPVNSTLAIADTATAVDEMFNLSREKRLDHKAYEMKTQPKKKDAIKKKIIFILQLLKHLPYSSSLKIWNTIK